MTDKRDQPPATPPAQRTTPLEKSSDTKSLGRHTREGTIVDAYPTSSAPTLIPGAPPPQNAAGTAGATDAPASVEE